jgi:hypothetical protein
MCVDAKIKIKNKDFRKISRKNYTLAAFCCLMSAGIETKNKNKDF